MTYYNPYPQSVRGGLGQANGDQSYNPHTGTDFGNGALMTPDQSTTPESNDDLFYLPDRPSAYDTAPSHAPARPTRRASPRTRHAFDISNVVDPTYEQLLAIQRYAPPDVGPSSHNPRIHHAVPQALGAISNTNAQLTPSNSTFFNGNNFNLQAVQPAYTAANSYQQGVIPGFASSSIHDPRAAPFTGPSSNSLLHAQLPDLRAPAPLNTNDLHHRGATFTRNPFDFESNHTSGIDPTTASFGQRTPHPFADLFSNTTDMPQHSPDIPQELAIAHLNQRVMRGQGRRPAVMDPTESQAIDGPAYLREKRKRVTSGGDDIRAGDDQGHKISKRRKTATGTAGPAGGMPGVTPAKRTRRSKAKAAVPVDVDDDDEESDAFAYSTTPADGARANKKAREKKRLVDANDTAQVVDKEWPEINTDLTSTLCLADASKIATYISPLKIKGHDDWRAVRADKMNGIQGLMNAFKVALPTDPPPKEKKPFPEELKPLWRHNQSIVHNSVMEAITTHPHRRFLESCCTVAWYALIEAHDTDKTLNAGPRQCGSMAVNTKMKCSERLQAMTDGLACNALVRQDVITGQRIHDFVANPKSFTSKKTVNQRNNGLRKPENRFLVNQRGSRDDDDE